MRAGPGIQRLGAVRRSVMRRITPTVVAWVVAVPIGLLAVMGTVAVAEGIIHRSPVKRSYTTTVETRPGEKGRSVSHTSSSEVAYSVPAVAGVSLGGSVVAVLLGSAAGVLAFDRRKRGFPYPLRSL